MLIDKLLLWKYHDTLQHIYGRDKNTIYATELVECPKKREFRKQLWFLELFNSATLVGELVHYGIEHLLKEIIKDGYVEVEVEREKSIDNFVIKGRIDAIVDDVIYEFKFMRSIKGSLPLPHHVEQLQIYGWLTGLEEGYIVYITPSGLKEYFHELTYSDDNIRMLLMQKRVPRYEWECQYCAFSEYCPFSLQHQKSGRK